MCGCRDTLTGFSRAAAVQSRLILLSPSHTDLQHERAARVTGATTAAAEKAAMAEAMQEVQGRAHRQLQRLAAATAEQQAALKVSRAPNVRQLALATSCVKTAS